MPSYLDYRLSDFQNCTLSCLGIIPTIEDINPQWMNDMSDNEIEKASLLFGALALLGLMYDEEPLRSQDDENKRGRSQPRHRSEEAATENQADKAVHLASLANTCPLVHWCISIAIHKPC
jgi:hypothetical protein